MAPLREKLHQVWLCTDVMCSDLGFGSVGRAISSSLLHDESL